ncbi:hypothetical protein EC973_000636 [Apophysomyces ossiformis]|uniref:Enhancer of rudimentary n=1 Tax=Apophysomyces ossiformis TaxID=679940 RepID=A0A8H7C0B9_9FUNG|nr:hypothetical protein EC973_000636 [Apophysomyces ossiformis]
MDHIAGLFEQQLQRENPRLGQVQYKMDELFRYIDSYKEFVALVFDPATKNYQPHDKQWIKDRLISHFSRHTNQPSQPSYRQPQNRPYGNRRW